MIVFLSYDSLTLRFCQTNSLAVGLYAAMKASIASRNSLVFLKLAPRKVFLDKIPNQISTWFNQLADVGVK